MDPRQPVDVVEVSVVGNEIGTGLHGVGGDPDVVRRNRTPPGPQRGCDAIGQVWGVVFRQPGGVDGLAHPQPELGDAVAEPPPPVDPTLARQFFSGVISGPDFCTNRSLGGARTYALDGDGDGVAEVCSLPYTRREAVARQNALEAFTTPREVFASAVALACRDLGTTAFEGDAPADLASDACA